MAGCLCPDAHVDTWITADRDHCWHPFTRQGEWEKTDPLVLVGGSGVWLTDSKGRKYIDGNASIWTNIHGHGHPVISQAIKDQLDQVAHTSYLGFANPRASELAERLCGFFPDSGLERVFYSDDGSTAVECAVKMAIQYRLQTGEPDRTEFIAFDQCYHGDTMGAASLGGVGAFFERFRKFGFPVQHVRDLDELLAVSPEQIGRTAAVVIEPLVQGVNQIRPWPEGMLRAIRHWCDQHGVHLILDEVMTGFGRTGSMFACQREEVVPDFLCLAKGLTGGYLPLAATLVQAEIYQGFLGGAEKAFYYGHSYTANQLGCAAALANLDLFEQEQTLELLPEKVDLLGRLLNELAERSDLVIEIRQCGLVAGGELRAPDGSAFPVTDRVGETVCLLARDHGLLTRAILDTVVVLPPLSITADEIRHLCAALEAAINDWSHEQTF
ncbi:adenosylmethionine--8-amino-7-oxononanoate transaminase [Verrucomicrobiaceae bacterium 5K15]|uniref:Adenosylmethionine-8-amino-7-oxononanoate aminotransferase n=1 Tax=Oceaniferula flava TaxID=2800421 RepID=A0AAE2SEB8_9BACT|nr:adenosylmethionine--8-amino-7-oxononanoate transaminase [Oceaniferula flavus]MBM1137605.1 adenosylmethionine--8-amino-7-oxononanoate transaminase [Oceaniferula flavus]